MFSGIVQDIGTVEDIKSKNDLLEITISSKRLINDLQISDSVAVDGCCLTVTEIRKEKSSFKVQVTDETISKTNFSKLKLGSKVNLEPSLKVGDNLGGHLVLGHIDSTGEVSDVLSFNGNKIIKISFSKELNDFIAQKGSIAVNGVSLTVIESKNNNFSFTLIPYTSDNTNLGLIKAGDPVNLEVDLISRYLINYLRNNLSLLKK